MEVRKKIGLLNPKKNTECDRIKKMTIPQKIDGNWIDQSWKAYARGSGAPRGTAAPGGIQVACSQCVARRL